MDPIMIFHRWKNAKLAVIGKDHISDNKPCQDKVESYAQNGIYAIALADGAGSRKFSDKGAEIVTKTVVKYLVEQFDDLIISMENEKTDSPFTAYHSLRKRLIVHISEALNAYTISNSNVEYRDLASTMLFVVFKDDQYVMGHLGDGLIVSYQYQLGEAFPKIMSIPENGAASNITFFMTENDVDQHLRLYKGDMSNILGFLLMSDGPEEVLYDERTGLNANVESLFTNFHLKDTQTYAQQLQRLLSERIAQISYDDLSLNLIYLDAWLFDGQSDNLPFIEGIRDLGQVKRLSKDSYLLDGSISPQKNQFATTHDLIGLLRNQL